VANAADPVCENSARALLRKNPGMAARLVVCENLVGANAKVAKLAQLENLAAHDLIITCDGRRGACPPAFSREFSSRRSGMKRTGAGQLLFTGWPSP